MFKYFYSNSFQHVHTLVEMINQKCVTNIYQVEQHRLDMHTEPDKFHKHIYQDLDILCNDDAKLQYSFLFFQKFLQELGNEENFDNTKTRWRFYVAHIFVLNVIMTAEKLDISLAFVVLCISSI